jgi:hypothetical protein
MEDRPAVNRSRLAGLSFLFVGFLVLAFFVNANGISVFWIVLAGIVLWKINKELKRTNQSIVPAKATTWILLSFIALVLVLVLLGLFVRPA